MIPPLLDNGPTALIRFSLAVKKNGGPFVRARQVSGRGKTTRWGSEENLRSRNERAVTQGAACNTVRRCSMGLWSKFDPDKTRALIHLMTERPDRYGREAGGIIRKLRCTLKVTDSQSTDDRQAFAKFDPSGTKPLTSNQ